MHIAWVGDSITVGSSAIASRLLFDKKSPIRITALAKVGAPLPWMAGQRVPDDADVVVLAGGTNDLVGVSAEDAFKRLKETRATLQSGGKKVIVATIPPSVARTDKTEKYNALIRSLPSSEFIDTGGKLSPQELSSDGVHPSKSGYDRLASLYVDAFQGFDKPWISYWPWALGGVVSGVVAHLVWSRAGRKGKS